MTQGKLVPVLQSNGGGRDVSRALIMTGILELLTWVWFDTGVGAERPQCTMHGPGSFECSLSAHKSRKKLWKYPVTKEYSYEPFLYIVYSTYCILLVSVLNKLCGFKRHFIQLLCSFSVSVSGYQSVYDQIDFYEEIWPHHDKLIDWYILLFKNVEDLISSHEAPSQSQFKN